MTQPRILQILFALIVIGCLYGIVASTADRADYTIRIGLLSSKEDEDFAGASAFKQIVEERTNNAVAVEIYTSGQFCANERECVESLQSGVLDVFMTTFGGLGGFFGEGQVFDVPYMFRDDAIAECVFDGPIVGEVRDAVLARDLGLRLMTVTNTGGWRSIGTTGTLIQRPTDLRGLKIRTIPAPIQQELVKTLGANPTPIAWSELYLALATGVVEGTKNSVQDIIAQKLEEHIKYLTLDNHAYMGAIWWYSDRRWAALPVEFHPILAEGFDTLKDVGRALPKERAADAYERFEAAGGAVYRLTPEDRQAFLAASTGMKDWYVRQYGEQWLVKTEAAIAECEAANPL